MWRYMNSAEVCFNALCDLFFLLFFLAIIIGNNAIVRMEHIYVFERQAISGLYKGTMSHKLPAFTSQF